MRIYPFLRLSRSLLIAESLGSANCSRFASSCSQKWSIGGSDNLISSRDKCNTHCLTTSLFNPISSPLVDLIIDLTNNRLSSLYLKWHQLSRSLTKSWLASVNYFSDGNEKKENPFGGSPFNDQFDKFLKDLPPLLMDFVDPATTPGPFSSIKNVFTTFFVIKTSYDPSFSYRTFLDGARQALLVIADNLSRGETKPLEDLVDPETLSVVRENLVKFSPVQMADLKVEESDIVFWLAKEIAAFERDNRKFVEITVIFHVLKGYQEKMNEEKRPPFFMPDMDATFCNYRFIREYTKGVDGEWTCNRLNHFKWGHFLQNSPFAR